MMNKTMKFSLGAAFIACSLASTAQAESDSTTINSYAGLAPVMELACGDVNFGVWRVPTGTRTDGVTEVTLTAASETSITSAGSSANIALSNTHNAPKAGTCNVTGSAATTGTGIAALTGASGNFGPNGGSGFNGEILAAPNEVASSFTYLLALSSTAPTISAEGTASFTVQGTMSIPDSLTAANYGGYKSPSITVSFNDNQ